MSRFVQFLTVFALVAATAVQAQQVSGRLEGRVVDELGQPVPGVNIAVHSNNLQGIRGAASNVQGRFLLPALPVGQYQVEISHTSYQPLTYEKITLRLGRTTDLGTLKLVPRTAELGEVVVSGDRLPIDPTTASLGTNLQSDTFESLPVERDFRALAALVPQANTSYYRGDDINIGGSTGLENAYYIDGVHVTDPFLAAGGTALPHNFIREVEIKTGGFEAEYGRSQGGIINAVTHSGGNEFSGQVFGFFTDHQLARAYRRTQAQSGIGDFQTYDIGASIGGPLVRDQLWFFAAYNPSFDNFDVGIPGLGSRRDRQTQHLLAAKLTWRAGPHTDAMLTVLGDPTSRRRIGFTFQGMPEPNQVENPEPYLGSLESGGISAALQANHRLGQGWLLEGALSVVNRRDNDVPDTQRGLSEPFFGDFITGIWSGGYGRQKKNDSRRTAVQASATHFAGRHTWKTGLAYEDNKLDNLFTNSTGADGQDVGMYVRPNPTFYVGIWSLLQPTVHNRVLSAYIQDAWQVNKRLRLNLGFRWDGQYLIGSDGEVAQKILGQYQPRLGFTYQTGAAGAQQLTGSFGRYYEQLPLEMSTLELVTGQYLTYVYPEDPRSGAAAVDTMSLNLTIQEEVNGLEGQHFDEFTLGYERRLGSAYKVGTRGVYRTLRQVVDLVRPPGNDGFIVGNAGEGALGFVPRRTRRYAALELTLERLPGARGHWTASYVLARNRGNYGGLYQAEENQRSPNTNILWRERSENQTGLLPNDRTHSFKLYGAYKVARGLSAGTWFSWQSGTPLNELAHGLFEASVLFVSPRGSQGRTPSIWDWNMRLTYEPEVAWSPRLILDVFHLFSRRTVVNIDQLHYFNLDEEGNPVGENPNYLQPITFQDPMTVRLGAEFNF
ncbi:MAG: TonB-dependent receptor plug domain-containing protein [Candidatus Latescibacteria bacterium]|nr:TonB-dependent receptor plug domain-containing protein [Candidatus Latescibacterota bacterium]